ncbi:hypothetical protein TRFO_25859 [Tritrichomonas foetus]|uniref:Uncharacterized protein n=1 Tax=Tritrichomonas foetus TaxID=1144522 RepID=A0A1J4K9P6_9EUKA|nr:hypothetical protein TRFO_25859 [Tritrichomonas foetus]|eukprot:OHT06165.1 hypothetical protein TRFO_25859 [Tritrichomonas foetus]
MAELYTESEIGALRHLVLETTNPSDEQLQSVSPHSPLENRKLIRLFLTLLLDSSATNTKICSVFNSHYQKSSPKAFSSPSNFLRSSDSSQNVSPFSQQHPSQQSVSLALPPKFRGKTPHNSHQPKSHIEPIADRSQARIPMLPRCATSPSAVSRHLNDHVDPTIGSLAAVLHPMLGPAHVCRVLSKRPQNNGTYYLVSFFQSELSPCYVPSEYLFQLEPHIGFPLGNEPEFRRAMETRNVSVDWLLERIFSSAQNLVINHSEVLFPSNGQNHTTASNSSTSSQNTENIPENNNQENLNNGNDNNSSNDISNNGSNDGDVNDENDGENDIFVNDENGEIKGENEEVKGENDHDENNEKVEGEVPAWRPEPPQVQQIMFQCVSCAALLLTCYVSCRWKIPDDKMEQILATIFKTNPSKFTTTAATIEAIKTSILQLISISEK